VHGRINIIACTTARFWTLNQLLCSCIRRLLGRH